MKTYTELTKDDFELLKDQQIILKLGKAKPISVRVFHERRDTRSGTYGTGLKFHTTTYGVLQDTAAKKFSADGGKTWHWDIYVALKSKGKFMLKRETRKEFAYDSIQRINAQYNRGFF